MIQRTVIDQNSDSYDFTSALVDDVKGMRIGIPKDYFGDGLDAEVKENILQAVKVLEEKMVRL